MAKEQTVRYFQFQGGEIDVLMNTFTYINLNVHLQKLCTIMHFKQGRDSKKTPHVTLNCANIGLAKLNQFS